MTARMRRLASDFEQVRKDFAGHKNIIVTPVGSEPPEKYHVTYFVNGIYLQPDGKVETLARHEVDIILHSDYPRYKPICKILTPIWHPNFRDGQICIGDIWGAGESLTDIIINIGDMIQYKSWNSSSPLSADAAKWALDNKHLFPVGNIDLNVSDYASATEEVEIDLFDDEPSSEQEVKDDNNGLKETVSAAAAEEAPQKEEPTPVYISKPVGNDFDITPEELAGITYVPTEQRMHVAGQGGTVKSGSVNFKTVLQKGILWALIGALVGFCFGELLDDATNSSKAADILGYSYLSDYFKYDEKATDEFNAAYKEYEEYCEENDLNPDASKNFEKWYNGNAISDKAQNHIDKYSDYDEMADDALYDSYRYEFASDEDDLGDAIKKSTRVSTGFWSAIIAMFIGLLLGIGEGVFYGSMKNAGQFGMLGAGISLALGFVSGDVAQYMYASMLGDDPSLLMSSLIRGIGWAVMGIGIGLAVGLIRPEKKRILFCIVGGIAGAFIGGFVFNYVCKIVPNDVVARCVGIVIMGILIGVGIGLLEQFAKQAWLKVVRGEFEGKEYLVFAGTTSIGNNGKNSIVLFKDKLVGPHHCDIILEGSKYILVDCGTPMGTVVNGMRISRCILKQGDTIAIGNSVLVFNTK